jgi:hypothetical protein
MLDAIITKCHDNVTGGLIFVLPCKKSGKSTFGFFKSQMSNRASTVPRTTASGWLLHCGNTVMVSFEKPLCFLARVLTKVHLEFLLVWMVNRASITTHRVMQKCPMVAAMITTISCQHYGKLIQSLCCHARIAIKVQPIFFHISE